MARDLFSLFLVLRLGQTIATSSNIVGRCCTLPVARGGQTNTTCLMQHLAQGSGAKLNLPRILRPSTSSSDHLLAIPGLTVSLTLCPFFFYWKSDRLCLSFPRRQIQNFVRSPHCSLDTHATMRDREANINNKSSPWIQIPAKSAWWACARSTMLNTMTKRMQHCCSHLRTKEMFEDVEDDV